MKSTVIKRSIIIEGQKTSISIEDIFWVSLKEIAHKRRLTLSTLVASIKDHRVPGSNLSSAVRVYVLRQFQSLSETLACTGDLPVLARREPRAEVERSTPEHLR